jgi:hypothetical protein
MNEITLIEILLVLVIVVAQTAMALKTKSQIRFFATIIPNLKNLKIKRYNIPFEDLKTFAPKDILQNLSTYDKIPNKLATSSLNLEVNDHTEPFSFMEEKSDVIINEVSLIIHNQNVNIIFDEIILAINVYLLRNKGAATDFNLIKDVVERNIDMEDEDISHSVTIPLYLGLMGTMVGIVFGLINMFLVYDSQSDLDIKPFLGGVAIAMFASFWGLFWTVFNSSFNLKTSRRSLDRAKNSFYTFIQTELLPVINQSVSSSIHTLHSNLLKFNENFTYNLNLLSGMLHKNHDALVAQERILLALENIDITEFAKANVKILKELRVGIEQLDKFNQYINNLNHLVHGTTQLSNSFDDLLIRSNNFHGIAEKLDSRIDESNKLIQFLNDHFQHLEERGDIIRNSVVKVDDVMIKSLKQLEDHTQTKIDAIKQITVKEEDLMTQAFAENRSNISKLALLEDVKTSIDEFKRNSIDSIGLIKKEIESLKASVKQTNNILLKSNSQTTKPTKLNFLAKIMRLFSRKKFDIG